MWNLIRKEGKSLLAPIRYCYILVLLKMNLHNTSSWDEEYSELCSPRPVPYSQVGSEGAGLHGSDWEFEWLLSDIGIISLGERGVLCDDELRFWQQGIASDMEAKTACNRS